MYCTQNVISNGIFHRNRNIPSNILQQLRTLKSKKDSEKEEWTWRHLPLRLQTTSRSCSNHNSEELAQTQAQGLEERIESPGIKPHVCGQFMKSQERVKRKGQSFQETVTGKLATYTKEHHWPSSRSYRNLTKNPPFCTWSSFTPSPLRWTSGQCSAGHRKRLLCPHFPLLQCLPAGEHWGNPAPLSLDTAPLSTSLSPDDPEETKLLPAGHQAKSEGKCPVPTGQSGVWRPLRAAREERAPRAHRPQRAHPEPALLWALRLETQTEMEPKISMTLLNTRLENNWLKLIKNHTEWKEHKHKLCNWHHISIKTINILENNKRSTWPWVWWWVLKHNKKANIQNALNKLIKTLTFKNVYIHSVKDLTQENQRTKC